MQFIKNGPDVPDRLLQKHEEGQVVLFCGAGISCPAGLPLFGELVSELYGELMPDPDGQQSVAIKAKQHDRAIGLLEDKHVGGREKVRARVAEILTPGIDGPKTTATHEALLTLGRDKEKRTRLVTTNFDRLFEEAINREGLDVKRCEAPGLPVPKSRWDALVYLHGLLPANAASEKLDHLVLSSGDFGMAYLIEGWAARFVSELFRNFTVCFIGYSIDDPVLRYMTDALAADRLLGETRREMFAFGCYSKDKKGQSEDEWKAKSVTPILYRRHSQHAYLHKTLREWAKTYRDGIRGKESIIVRYAGLRPATCTKQDDFVGRVLWALSDPSGVPAKRFADLDPVPHLDWLEPLSKRRYRQAHLIHSGVPPQVIQGNDLAFRLLHRPAPYTHAPWMSLSDTGATRWDEVMFQLSRWLLRHLDDPKLVLWLTDHRMPVHPIFAGQVTQQLKKLEDLEQAGKKEKLGRIRENAPRAIPSPPMRTLWHLLLSGRINSSPLRFDSYGWKDRFRRDGLTASLRLELREMLTPRLSVRSRIMRDDAENVPQEPNHVKELVDYDIVLSAESEDMQSILDELREEPGWPDVLADMLDDFRILLRDTMDLARECGDAEDRRDYSYVVQPSISDHPQNRRSSDWTALIEFSRDAWLETAKRTPEKARRTIETWLATPYPVFRRLAFFAASQDDIVPPRQALDWLLTDDNWWLWSVETQRETMRLLDALMPVPEADLQERLERAVLAGPPRSMFEDEIEQHEWEQRSEWEIWKRLAKMIHAGAVLGVNAQTKWGELISRHPEWRLQPDERDEFSFWIGDGSELDEFAPTPRRSRELVDWLRQHPGEKFFQKDDWRLRCEKDFDDTANALRTLALEDKWPTARWLEALQVWSEEQLIERSWRYMAPTMTTMPDQALQAIARVVGRWLEGLAKKLECREEIFLDLCRRILALEYQEGSEGDSNDTAFQEIIRSRQHRRLSRTVGGGNNPVFQAINHPVGHVTKALLDWWWRDTLEEGQGLPDRLGSILAELCDTRVGKFRHGRVVLAGQVGTLFFVDREWSKKNLLPFFDWESGNAEETQAVWQGYLRSPSLDDSLMQEIREPFLATSRHYGMLGRYDAQFANLLTYAALDQGAAFSVPEFREATRALPKEGLLDAAKALVSYQKGAGERGAEFWKNRTLPYLRKIWPQSQNRLSREISAIFARLCIAAQAEFPNAVEELKHRLQPPRYPERLLIRLKKSKLCEQFPEHAVKFLGLVTDDESSLGDNFAGCLKQIQSAEPSMKNDRDFGMLVERLRKSGGRWD